VTGGQPGEAGIIARAARRELESGNLQRDLAELRDHLAWVERQLPPRLQKQIAEKFGSLLPADQ
jgi:hypothetical protein